MQYRTTKTMNLPEIPSVIIRRLEPYDETRQKLGKIEANRLM
jgi:hypothetical protein